jgi:hypothetical protein
MTAIRTAPGDRTSTRWWAVAGAAAGTGGLAWLLTHDPNTPGHYPACFLLSTTGYYCPACGGTRATYDLLHGDVAGAFARHPLVPLLYLGLVLGLGYRWLRRRHERLPALRVPTWVYPAAGVALLVFGVLRNVPGWEFISPA